MSAAEEWELYLHLPFCVRKCRYCDFLSFPAGEEEKERYVRALIEEIATQKNRPQAAGRPVVSVFLGGGTPSLLSPSQIRRILEAVRSSFALADGAEITMEANPGTCGKSALSGYREAGVNRLSLGLQSVHEDELRGLGRIHTFADFLATYEAARAQGFENINVDLMSGLPGQTESAWEETLRRVIGLSPEHISAYSLIIEEGTPFGTMYGAMSRDLEVYGEYEEIPARRRASYGDLPPLPGERADRRMYRMTKELLADAGYARYEISNYARPGRECVHNTGYWTGRDYLGLGLGAASLERGSRFSVTADLKRYLGFDGGDFAAGRQYGDVRRLSKRERMEEFMFLGLRLIRGIRAKEFIRRFAVWPEEIYGAVFARLTEQGLLSRFGGETDPERRYALTDFGLDVSNAVLAEFLLDERE